MKFFAAITILFFLFAFHKRPDTSLAIYFMPSFDNDSVLLSTPTHQHALRATGITSLEDTMPQAILPITSEDSTVTIRDVVRDKQYTVKYKPGHQYLFIYYNQQKFTMRFAKKLLYVE